MQVLYGDVELKMVFLKNFEKRARFTSDRTTYLWTDFKVDCVCIYNSLLTSYNAGPAAGVVNPITTQAALRHYLAQPRRTLIIRHPDGSTLLEAPKAGYTVDNDNGPRCTVQRIDQPTGNRTFEVHLTFEASLNECAEDHHLLAHRWKRHLEIDHDYLTTVVTEGECVFNLPVLVLENLSADYFRKVLFHPIPYNFSREHVAVTQESDGYVYRYRTIDRERMFNLGLGCPAIRVEAYKTCWVHKPSMRDKLLDAPSEILGAINPFSGGSGPTAGMSIGRRIANFGLGLIPKPTFHVLARAWGPRNLVNRDSLRETCFGIIAFQLNLTAFTTFMIAEDFTILEDVAGRFVQVDKTVTLPPEFYLGELFRRGGALLDSRTSETIGDFFKGVSDLSATLPADNIENPHPYVNGAFGSTIVNLIRQALLDPCELPEAARPRQVFADLQRELE